MYICVVKSTCSHTAYDDCSSTLWYIIIQHNVQQVSAVTRQQYQSILQRAAWDLFSYYPREDTMHTGIIILSVVNVLWCWPIWSLDPTNTTVILVVKCIFHNMFIFASLHSRCIKPKQKYVTQNVTHSQRPTKHNKYIPDLRLSSWNFFLSP